MNYLKAKKRAQNIEVDIKGEEGRGCFSMHACKVFPGVTRKVDFNYLNRSLIQIQFDFFSESINMNSFDILR